MRKTLIAGNWKMFLDVDRSVKLVEQLCESDIDFTKVDVMVAPSHTSLYVVGRVLSHFESPISLVAQNFHIKDEGAYTGEVSLPMVKSCGADIVLVGHSERRNLFGETDDDVHTKVEKALNAGLRVILCIGEKLEERESGNAVNIVLGQVGKALAGVASLERVIVAYEPVWAIGTGMTASPEDAQRMHKAIRSYISKVYGSKCAEEVRILYGGSVNAGNIASLIECEDIDGALVGGASLSADKFLPIVKHYKGR